MMIGATYNDAHIGIGVRWFSERLFDEDGWYGW